MRENGVFAVKLIVSKTLSCWEIFSSGYIFFCHPCGTKRVVCVIYEVQDWICCPVPGENNCPGCFLEVAFVQGKPAQKCLPLFASLVFSVVYSAKLNIGQKDRHGCLSELARWGAGEDRKI